MTQDNHRLPTHVVPNRYQLELTPDLSAAEFVGSVLIDVEIVTATKEIICNAAELEIVSAAIVFDDQSRVCCEHYLDATTERLHLQPASAVPAGHAQIEMAYRGILNDQLRGFYRSTFTDESGVAQTIATTQFQSTDARRAFPCWDEPAFKARFSTTLLVDQEHLAISNTSIISEKVIGPKRQVRFAETMPMSTYLVAFVVGPLQVSSPIDVDGVPVRLVHRPGRGHLVAFALDVARHALRWFSDYYAIAYPADKLDLVAIPDFAFGAMENLGCVTFREVLLLIDPEQATQTELQNATAVICHEIAHMWFGNLVTMKWWEGIWLNEAFATFMEISCSDAFRPDWQSWNTFCRGRAAAFATDSLRSTRPIEFAVATPDEAEQMFDVITYEKGAAVLRMLEQHLGAMRFRDGVRHYLLKHQYANTNTSDLWDCLEANSGKSVRRMLNEWIYQGGYPLIELRDTANGVTISQRHFTLDPANSDSRNWAIPLRIRTRQGDAERLQTLLFDTPQTTLSNTSLDNLVTVNADGSGFFRTRPSATTIAAAVAGELTPSERHSVIDDAWALTVAQEMSVKAFLGLTFSFAHECDPIVWQALAASLTHLSRFVDERTAHSTAFTTEVAALAQRALTQIGLRPQLHETDRVKEMRATLIVLLGTVAKDAEVIRETAQLRHHHDTTLAAAALTVIAHHGSRSEFTEIRDLAKLATDPQTEQRHLRALTDFRHLDLIDELLGAIHSGEVRTQDGPYLIRRALANQSVGGQVWEFVVTNWESLTARFPSNSAARMLEGIVWLDHPKQVTAVNNFLATHPVPQGETQISQHLERQRINAALRARVQQSDFEFSCR